MTIEYIVVHCSATPPSMDIGVDKIREWHLERGWRDVGYNYIVRRDGTVEAGRPEGDTLAHAHGYNTNSIAICLVGGVNEFNAPQANFTGEQGASLRAFISWMERRYPGAVVCGHRDLPGVPKDCPSFSVANWRSTGHFTKPKKSD
jgi:N-acetyl-anhydromuramyl-L-alanine amidase AmpD